MKRPPRDLTPEEEALWQQATGGDKRLSKAKKRTPTLPTAKPEKITVKKRVFNPLPAKPGTMQPAPKQKGIYAGIDKNTAERFRKGKYPLDGTLDLHGMTSEKAYGALMRFIDAHYNRGSRCLLIITGKGKMGSGVLKSSLPGWLSHEEVAPMILTFDSAQVKDGGSGAYYVLLRRQR
ncbi:MAG: Smr/MutS family protein [Rickettsiales bacterium]